MKHYHLMTWPALTTVVLDQLSKWLVVKALPLYETIPVIPRFFNLVHIRNRGMAFGFMNRSDMGIGFLFLVGASIVAILFILFWFFNLKEDVKAMTFGLSLVLGGAIGNLIDRLRLHEVIDFLDFFVGTHHYPAFNVADSAVTAGTCWIAICFLRQMRRKPG